MQTAAGVLLMIPDPTMITKIAAGVLAIGSAIQNFFFHPDCSKIATTQIVNQAEVFLQQNLAAWQALSVSEKTPEAQQAALMNFDNVWNQVLKACGSGQYGTAGQACITDRQQGGCHYQVAGQCWNWFVGYRDPIANDPVVAAAAGTSGVASFLGGGDMTPLLLFAGVGVLALVLLS
jgi:ribosome modulation factor